MVLIFDFDETVENGSSIESIQTVDFDAFHKHMFANLRSIIKIGRIWNQMMKNVSFIMVLEIGVSSDSNELLNLLDIIMFFHLANLEKGNLIHIIAVIDRWSESS